MPVHASSRLSQTSHCKGYKSKGLIHGFGFADTFLHCSKFLPPFFCHSDEYRIKPVEEVKYMKNGAEEEQKIAARNQENLVRTDVLCYQ